MGVRNKTCTECGLVGHPDKFAVGKRLCKECNRLRVAASRARKKDAKKLDIVDLKKIQRGRKPAAAKRAKAVKRLAGLEAFSTREGLSDMLKDNLARALEGANDQVEFNKMRLAAATESGDAELIDEANKGLTVAMAQHTQLTTRLMEKLQAMEDLRAQQEKAKPVTFIFVQAPQGPNIMGTREMPEDLK